ncbi:MAG: EpsG family protein [Christensenellales bacterium]|jgi:transmembrane protein EpsG
MAIQVQHSSSLILYAGSFALAVLFAALAQVFARPVKPVALSPSFTQTKRPHRVFWLLAFLVPFLLSAFRWKVGTDYPMYISLYEAINSISTPEQLWQQVLEVEPLYVLMNVLIKLVFNNPLPIFFFSSLLLLGFLFRAVEDYHGKISVMLAVLVFLTLMFSTTLNIMRQMIAVSITFYAARHLFQKQYDKAALWMFLALMFHYSAIVLLPFWLFRGPQRYARNARIAMFAALVLMFVLGSVFGSIFSGIRALYTDESGEGSTLKIGLMLLRLPIIVPILLFRKQLIAHDERNRFWIMLAVFEVLFSYLGYILDVLNRLSLYFAVSWIVLLPALVRSMPTRGAQYRMGAYVIAVCVGLWIFNTAINNYGDVLPYQTIFEARIPGM